MSSSSAIYGVQGKRVIQCNIRDITARKHAEQAAEHSRQAQKMETVGELAGGVAHDFNNLLGVILGNCELLEQRPDLSLPVRKIIVEIRNAGTCAKDLTRHLLAFGRRQVLQPVLLDLNATVTRAASMLKRMIGDDVQLISVLHQGLGTVKVDPVQIEQILMNLAINARDAMPKGGKITIETTNAEIDECEAREHVTAKPGRYVALTVSDTGVGMDKEIQSRVFDPFFSTKAVGKGTGLGLSTVFGIVKQSAGSICVSSEPGRGTTFTIYFPRYEELPAVVDKPAPAACGGSETILLVEDATALRGLTRRLLEDCGYKVLDTGDPAGALRIADEQQGLIPLMITDVVMPGLSGPALAEKLVAVRPETMVLYMSGYAADAIAQNGVLGPDHAFLEKPFTRDELVRKVREVLDAHAQQV